MKHLIKNGQIIQSGLPGTFTRENGEGFWGGYEERTDIHFIDGWRDEIIPEYNPILEKLSEPFYDTDNDVVTYEVIERNDLPPLETAKADKIKAIKLYARDLLFATDFYIVRRAETGKSVPQEILNARQAIRVWNDAQEKAVLALTTFEEVASFEIKY
ncbi:MAG TPA: hypothetical protein PKH68_01390 [Paludibacteraceae bacterium]|nr:hypothetical protein [Paludibacteraceae bacterium]